jgi:S-adenosylmethionine-diacylgycerolhomoserine-N-methlytransferase
MSTQHAQAGQPQRMEEYYRLHARIYDATRWSFLFGRNTIVALAAQHMPRPRAVLEVGCGTGVNLLRLCKAFPEAEIVGLDVADSMLQMARKNLGPRRDRVRLLHASYDRPLFARPHFDLIVCSYSLTMINPGWEQVIAHAHADLAPGGAVAVVDFHDSALPPFKRWMGVNHVRMDGHLLPELEARFAPRERQVRTAYGGVWQYLLFVGTKR